MSPEKQRLSANCPLCGFPRYIHDASDPRMKRWSDYCGPGDRCLAAPSLYMAGRIPSAVPPYDLPQTRRIVRS